MLSYTIYDKANLTAKYLLETDCVKFRPDDPFVLTSGRLSPVYVDVRRLLSHPRVRSEIVAMMGSLIFEDIYSISVDVIAGGETAGIPFASLVANRLDKPLVYVRKSPKSHGTAQQIEGGDIRDKRVLLVEDLISTGTAKKIFVDGIRAADGIISDILVVFSYGWQVELEGINIHSLCNFTTLLTVAEDLNYGGKPQVFHTIRNYLNNPDDWQNEVAEDNLYDPYDI